MLMTAGLPSGRILGGFIGVLVNSASSKPELGTVQSVHAKDENNYDAGKSKRLLKRMRAYAV